MDDYSSTLVLNLKMIFDNVNISGGRITSGVIVTITGRSQSVVYDGQSHSLTGYNVSINNPNYTTNDFSFSGAASASRTNVGTTNMGLAAEQFSNTNPSFRDVVFIVTDGFVKITGKPVTVTAVAKSKTYDNNSGTDPSLTATVSGTIGADTVTYTISRASGQNAGQYTITPTGSTTQGNYTVSYVTAKFTINPASCTLTAKSGTKTYSGSEQSVSGFTSTPSGLTFASTVKASGKGTNAGAYNVTFSGVTVNTTKDTTGNYVVTGTTNGTLTINPASVTLTAKSGTKTYTGSSQSVSGFTASVSGLTFASTVKASGSGTNAGTYSVTFSGVTINTTKDTTGNYVVTGTTNGTLTINPASCTLTAKSGTKTYNGSEQSVSGFTSTPSGLTFANTVKASGKGTNAGTYNVTFSGVTVNTTKDTTGNYVVTGTTKGTLTINKAAASALDLSVTNYSGIYDGSNHSVTASATVSSGTTFYYRKTTSESWTTTKPSWKNIGNYTVYVKATNANYNDATSSGTVQITSNVLISVSSTTTFYIESREHYITGEGYCSPTYTIPAGTYWFDYLTPGSYIFHDDYLATPFTALANSIVTVP